MSKNIKVALYVRVSTLEQNPENQTKILNQYCKERDWAIFDTYIDKGTSGLKRSRPGFNRLIKDMRSRKFNIIIIWKLDRIGRSLQHLLELAQEFNNKKIDLVVVTQNFDTTTSSGKFLFQVLGAVAEFESGMISERTKLGLARAKDQGIKLGRPHKNPLVYTHYCEVGGCRIKVKHNEKLCKKHAKQFAKLLQ